MHQSLPFHTLGDGTCSLQVVEQTGTQKGIDTMLVKGISASMTSILLNHQECLQASPPQCTTKRLPAAPCHDPNGRGRSGWSLQQETVSGLAVWVVLSHNICLWYQDATDMFTHLLRNRIIFIGQRINDEVSTLANAIRNTKMHSRQVCKMKPLHAQLVCACSWPRRLLPAYLL